MLHINEISNEDLDYFNLTVDPEFTSFAEDVYGPADAGHEEDLEVPTPAHVAGWTIRKGVQLINAGGQPQPVVARIFRNVGNIDPSNAEVKKNLKKLAKALTASATVDDIDHLIALAPTGWEEMLDGVGRDLFWSEIVNEEDSLPRHGISRRRDIGRKRATAAA